MKKNIVLNNENVSVDVLEINPNFVLFNFDGQEYAVNLQSSRDGKFILNYQNKNIQIVNSKNIFVVEGSEIEVALPSRTRNKKDSNRSSLLSMNAPMPGKILKILKAEGDNVSKGESILVMEAMKMEHTIKATKDGVVEKIFYKEGDQVQAKVELVKIC